MRFSKAIRHGDFDPARRQVVLSAGDVDDEGVKDPYLAIVGGTYYIFVHYAPRFRQSLNATQEELHGTGNIFATEPGKGSTGIATSLDGVNFEFNSARLDANSKRILDAIVEQVKGYTEAMDVEIAGHTDSLGSETYNQGLSEKRAES